MKKIKRSVEITVWHPERWEMLTVTNRKFGGFSCPGGKIEQGEDAAEAAYRELYEEAGVEAHSLEEVGTFPISTDENTLWLCTAFLADIGNQTPIQVEEGTVPSWKKPEEILEKALFHDWYVKYFEFLGIK